MACKDSENAPLTLGKTVGKQNLRSQKTNISTMRLPTGLYFLHITAGNERKVLKINVQ